MCSQFRVFGAPTSLLFQERWWAAMAFLQRHERKKERSVLLQPFLSCVFVFVWASGHRGGLSGCLSSTTRHSAELRTTSWKEGRSSWILLRRKTQSVAASYDLKARISVLTEEEMLPKNLNPSARFHVSYLKSCMNYWHVWSLDLMNMALVNLCLMNLDYNLCLMLVQVGFPAVLKKEVRMFQQKCSCGIDPPLKLLVVAGFYFCCRVSKSLHWFSLSQVQALCSQPFPGLG